MTERKRNPEEILEEMINKNVKFQVFEIFSGVAAGLGTIAVAVGQNAVLAAAPLTLSIALNYLNRRRLDQLTRQQTLLDITEVQRRLSSEIQGIRGQSPLATGDVGVANVGQFENAIASLSETVASLEMRMHQGGVSGADTSHLDAELVQLRNHQLDLSQSIEAVNQQLRIQPVANTDSSHLEAEINTLKEHIAQLQSISAPMALADVPAGVDLDTLRHEVQSQLSPLHGHLNDLEARLAQVHQAAQPAAPIDVEPLRAELRQMVAPVQQQVFSLEERLIAQPVATTTTVGSEEVEAVRAHVNVLNDKLDSIAAQLSAEIAGFQQSVEHTQDRLQAVHQQVEAVHQDVSAVPVGLQPESIHQEMQAAIGPLREQLVAFEHKLSSVPATDPNVSQLQSEQMISLQNQLNGVNGLIEEIATQFTSELSKVHSELSKVPQWVEQQIDSKVANLQPAQAPEPKKDALSELDAILADINL